MKDWEYRNMQEKIAADQTDRIINEMRNAEHRAAQSSGSAASGGGVEIPWGAVLTYLVVLGALIGWKMSFWSDHPVLCFTCALVITIIIRILRRVIFGNPWELR